MDTKLLYLNCYKIQPMQNNLPTPQAEVQMGTTGTNLFNSKWTLNLVPAPCSLVRFFGSIPTSQGTSRCKIIKRLASRDTRFSNRKSCIKPGIEKVEWHFTQTWKLDYLVWNIWCFKQKLNNFVFLRPQIFPVGFKTASTRIFPEDLQQNVSNWGVNSVFLHHYFSVFNYSPFFHFS